MAAAGRGTSKINSDTDVCSSLEKAAARGKAG